MQISFFPALGTHTCVPVGSHITSFDRDENAVSAAFTARLSHEDYAEVLRTGVRIEVWTNAPSGTRPPGEWGPIAFEEAEEIARAPDSEDHKPFLSLASDDQFKALSPVEVRTPRTHVFRAALTLPRNTSRIFAFTYRLIYPSGICWLGSDRDNGVLELDSGSSAFFEENGFWESRGKRRASVGHRESGQPADAEDGSVVGKLDVTEWSWSGWATDGSRVWSVDDSCLERIQDARLAYLIPTNRSNSVLLPQTHVIHAPGEVSQFSVTAQGHFILRSCREDAAIEYRVHDISSKDDIELLRSDIQSSCAAPYIFPTKDTDTILLAPNYDSNTAMTMYPLSLTRTLLPLRAISLPITSLDAFAKHSPTLSLFIPETRSVLFVNRSEQPGDLLLRFGPGGAQVIVTAVYDLAWSTMPSPTWQVSLPECNVAPEDVAPSTNMENSLPTPPASPQSRPRRTVSFILPSDDVGDSELRQRKPVEPSAPPSERKSVARRVMRSDSAFDRLQNASGSEKVRLVIVNLLKLLARFMGVAVLRFLMFASRLLGGGRQPEVDSTQTVIKIDDAPSPPLQDDSQAGGEEGVILTLGSRVAVGESSSSEKGAIIETPRSHDRNTLSTAEADGEDQDHEEHSISEASTLKSTSPVLKWVLATRDGDTTPIRLLVHSDTAPEEVHKHLCIELNGEDVEKTSSSVHSVGDKTSMIELVRPEGPSSVLVVKLRR